MVNPQIRTQGPWYLIDSVCVTKGEAIHWQSIPDPLVTFPLKSPGPNPIKKIQNKSTLR